MKRSGLSRLPGPARRAIARRGALALGLVAALPPLSGVGCDDLTPQVGRLLTSSCAEPSTSGSSSAAYPAATGTSTPSYYGGAASTGCPDGGAEGGSNVVWKDAGVAGNLVIADQFNNRVIVINRSGATLWWFGDGSSVAGASSVVAPNDAELLPTSEVLIAGTGALMGGEPSCTGSGGCVDDRVLIVDYATRKIAWQFGGHAGGPGSGELWTPTSAVLVGTPSGDHVLVSDQGHGRVVEIDRDSASIVWQYPPAIDSGASPISPQSAERLPNGDTLITDQGGNRVLEVTTKGATVWQYPEVTNPAALDFPAFASRLPNGNTLIADSNNNRVLEIDSSTPGNIVWSYLAAGATWGDPAPTGAVRLANGHTLVTDLEWDQVIEVDHGSPPSVVYVHGGRKQAGALANELNQPYNAKVTGDYTGLSAP